MNTGFIYDECRRLVKTLEKQGIYFKNLVYMKAKLSLAENKFFFSYLPKNVLSQPQTSKWIPWQATKIQMVFLKNSFHNNASYLIPIT